MFFEKREAENKEFNDKMHLLYPEFFGERFDNTWPMPGWHNIIHDLLETIKHHCVKYNLKGFKILQVKEKFGGLRFYYGFEDMYDTDMDCIDQYVAQAEKRAGETCEYCGMPGEIQGKTWLKCVCKEHAINRPT